jgi:tetratricopeptide (TPR) repeat protein
MGSSNGFLINSGFCLAAGVILLGLLASSNAPAQAPAGSPAPETAPAASGIPLQKAYQDGAAAFARGDYATAAPLLETVVSQAPPEARIEVVYLTLAAAYMRSEQYAPATETLRKFLERYPSSPSRNEATVSLGFAALKAGNFETAIAGYKQLEADPKFRERALLGQGKVYLEWQQYDRAIEVLRLLVGTGVKNAWQAEGLLLLADSYAKGKAYDKAIATLGQLRKNVGYLPNIFRLNTVAFRLGDQLLNEKKADLALGAYEIVLSKQRVIELQEAGLQNMQKQLADNALTMRTDPGKVPELMGQNTFLSQSIAEASRMLTEYRKVPDFSSAHLLRLARAYAETRQHWEALAIYGEFLRRFPEDPQRQEALYGIAVESAEAGRIEETRRYAELYLNEFPDHPNADAIGYLLGTTALTANDPVAAETYFGRMLREQPNSKFTEQIRFFLGNSRFAQGKYEVALNDYRRYLTDFPNGQFVEESRFRIGLCQLLSGDYDAATTSLNDYLKTYPDGFFVPDARYRLGVCKFSASKYAEVIADCDQWMKDYPGAQLSAEVIALKADALAENDQIDEAIDAYQQAYNLGKNDGVIGYSLFAMRKLLQQKKDWKRIEAVFSDFVSRHPSHPSVLAGISAVTQAKARLGRADEARQYVADAILLTIADVRRETVEELIAQLVTLCVRMRPDQTGKRPEPQREFDRLMAEVSEDKTPVTQARLLYAKAELCRELKDEGGSEAAMTTLANAYKPDVLSPALLAFTGDFLLGKGDSRRATAYYERLEKSFPKSSYREYTDVGLGQIALNEGRLTEALRHFQTALEKSGARAKLKEATLGKANTLFALGRFDEARALFEAVASTREWRGEATASSIFALGQIESQAGNLPKAIAYYEKVYMGYRLYLPWVAKAYAANAGCYEKLGDGAKARSIYEEFLQHQNLSGFPEFETARKRLAEMTQG